LLLNADPEDRRDWETTLSLLLTSTSGWSSSHDGPPGKYDCPVNQGRPGRCHSVSRSRVRAVTVFECIAVSCLGTAEVGCGVGGV
jgi:hypothetical protein